MILHLTLKTSLFNRFRPREISLFLLISALSNCSTTSLNKNDDNWRQQRTLIEQTTSWQLRGRVNVQYHDESHTPRIQWQQQDDQYRIRLWGTFNAGNTIITGEPNLVTMEHDGEVITARSPESLILENLGYELPVSYLEFWIRSLPSPNSDAELIFNELNHLAGIKQDGWEIDYSDARQFSGITLPRRVEINQAHDDIRLRFIGLNWVLNPGEN